MRCFPALARAWRQGGSDPVGPAWTERRLGAGARSTIWARPSVRHESLLSGACVGRRRFLPTLHEEPGAASVILNLTATNSGSDIAVFGLQSSMVHVVPLAENEGMPYVMPSATTITDQTYPLRRVLYLYVNKNPKSSLPPAAKEFLAFLMSQEGQEAVVKAGFFPFPKNRSRRKRWFWDRPRLRARCGSNRSGKLLSGSFACRWLAGFVLIEFPAKTIDLFRQLLCVLGLIVQPFPQFTIRICEFTNLFLDVLLRRPSIARRWSGLQSARPWRFVGAVLSRAKSDCSLEIYVSSQMAPTLALLHPARWQLRPVLQPRASDLSIPFVTHSDIIPTGVRTKD